MMSTAQQPQVARFAGSSVVVTGASSGIGAAVAASLGAMGAQVIGLDVTRGEGIDPFDVASVADWDRLAERLTDTGLRGLVNCAGITIRSRFGDVTPDDFETAHRVNALGPLLGMQSLAPVMAPGASIVNVGSVAGLQGHYPLAYTASKWSLRGVTHAAALALGPRGIRVNLVHPGFIETPMTASAPPAFAEAAIAETPLGRAGAADEVADVVCFLLSEAAAFVTGAEIPVDGGASSHGAAKSVSDALLPSYTPPSQVVGTAKGHV